MKNIFIATIGVLTVLLSLQSCNEDIDLVTTFEETAIVYGILDQSDTLHKIKITRAFIGDGETSSLQISQIPDSSYFKSVTGTVTEIINGNEARVFTLDTMTIFDKEQTGVFYAPKQLVYFFKTPENSPLVGEAEYRLDLDINNGEFEVTSTTELVDNLSATNTLTNDLVSFRFWTNQEEFQSTNVGASNVGNSHRMNTTLTVEFTEWRGTDATPRSFEWLAGETNVNPGASQIFSANGSSFFELIQKNCTDDPAITKRTFNGIKTTIVAAADDLVQYIDINKPTSSLAQNKPTFTNLKASKGRKAYGVFSSRQTVVVYKPFIDASNSNIRAIDKNTTRKLCTNGAAPFIFCSDHPADIAVGETWVCQ